MTLLIIIIGLSGTPAVTHINIGNAQLCQYEASKLMQAKHNDHKTYAHCVKRVR